MHNLTNNTTTQFTGSLDSNDSLDVRIIKIYSIVLYVIIITFCILGNGIVVVTILKKLHFRSTKNYFLLSIAIADMLIGIICMPSNFMFKELDDSTVTVFLCKTIPFLQGVTKTSSVYSFTVIAIERYVIITKPYRGKIRKGQCILVIKCIWFFSAVLFSPKLFVNSIRYSHNQFVCAESWSERNAKQYIIAVITLTYIFPVLISSIAYGTAMTHLWKRKIPGSQDLPENMKRTHKKIMNRVKVCRRMLRILLVFILLYLPSTVMTILWYFGKDLQWKPPRYIWIVAFHAEIIKYASSAVNPILFCVLDPSFRAAIRLRCSCKSTKQQETSFSSPYSRSTSV